MADDHEDDKVLSVQGEDRNRRDKLSHWLHEGHGPPPVVTVVDGSGHVRGTAHWDEAAGGYVTDYRQTRRPHAGRSGGRDGPCL